MATLLIRAEQDKMKISEVFSSALLNADYLTITPVTVRDRKGKETKAQGMPDVLPAIMGMAPEYMSYQYQTPEGPRIIYGSALIPFMTATGTIFQKYTKEYVQLAQLAVGEALKIDMKKLEENGSDGFQLTTDNKNISEKAIDAIYDKLEKLYPLGPVTAGLVAEITACGEELMEDTWEKGDNYKAYISYIIIKGISQFANTCFQIVDQQIVGPLHQVIKMRAQEEQVAQAMGKSAGPITDLTGRKLTSENIGKIVGLDGKVIHNDETIIN